MRSDSTPSADRQAPRAHGAPHSWPHCVHCRAPGPSIAPAAGGAGQSRQIRPPLGLCAGSRKALQRWRRRGLRRHRAARHSEIRTSEHGGEARNCPRRARLRGDRSATPAPASTAANFSRRRHRTRRGGPHRLFDSYDQTKSGAVALDALRAAGRERMRLVRRHKPPHGHGADLEAGKRDGARRITRVFNKKGGRAARVVGPAAEYGKRIQRVTAIAPSPRFDEHAAARVGGTAKQHARHFHIASRRAVAAAPPAAVDAAPLPRFQPAAFGLCRRGAAHGRPAARGPGRRRQRRVVDAPLLPGHEVVQQTVEVVREVRVVLHFVVRAQAAERGPVQILSPTTISP